MFQGYYFCFKEKNIFVVYILFKVVCKLLFKSCKTNGAFIQDRPRFVQGVVTKGDIISKVERFDIEMCTFAQQVVI